MTDHRQEIVSLIKDRLYMAGADKYKPEMDVHDGRNWMQESLEEALDLAVYLAAKLIEIKGDE